MKPISILSAACVTFQLVADPGALDPAFDIGTGFEGSIHVLARQPDNKLVVGGAFSAVNLLARTNLTRLQADGTVDTSFLPAAHANNPVYALALQPDGKVLVGGAFTILNGTTRNRLGRLNADGSLDPTFNPGTGFNNSVVALAIQSDGKILVGGDFTAYNGTAQPYLVRLLSDGTLDATFAIGAGPNSSVWALALTPDGSILLGGAFTTVAGSPRARLARLLSSGALDPAFDPAEGPNSHVRTLLRQPDGHLLIGGWFTQVNGTPRSYLARLTPEGLLDHTLAIGTGANNTVESLTLQADGKILVGGQFTTFNNTPHNRLVRLLPEGAIDPAFATGTGANGTVRALWIQPDGDLLVGGDFTQFNGLDRNRLVRLQGPSSAPGGTLEFAAGSFSVLEGAGSATIEVLRLGATADAVSVTYATANGTASVADYTPASGILNFAAGQTSASFTVTVLDDAELENDETVLLSLSNPTGGAVLGSRPGAVLILVNDDTPQAPGILDPGYVRPGANGPVNVLVSTPEGKLVAGGDFTLLAGANRNRLARLQADGTVDTSFLPAAHANNPVYALALQPDGKVLVGGAFTILNGTTRNRLGRLNADGSLDPTFNPGTGFNNSVVALAIQSDGKILVGGDFTAYNGTAQPYLVRLLSDGTLDATFAIGAGPNSSVWALALTPDGSILLGGAFTTVAGSPRARLARLLSSGALDPAFDPAEGPNSHVRTLLRQPDGHLLIGGWFTQVNGTPRSYLARLTPEGLLDHTLAIGTGANNTVESLTLQADGKILVGGQFTTFNNTPHNRLVRLLPEGAIDPAFATGTGANGTVRALWIQPDGDLLVGGDFTQFNGLDRNRLVRLQGDASAPAAPLRFLQVALAGPQIELLIQATPGHTYRIEATVNFAAWTTATSGIVTASPFQVTIPHSGQPAQFFRGVSAP